MNHKINTNSALPVIAMIPYANMAPFQEMAPPEGCEIVSCTPRESIAALREKKVFAAALPVGGLRALGDLVEPAGLFGIAAQGACLSVLFFSDCAFDRFTQAHTVRLTVESASSVRLLYLLLGYRLGLSNLPGQAGPDQPANGELVIGDTALSWMRTYEQNGRVHGYRYVTDLATQWYAHHQLPFVFARWVVHREAPPAFKSTLKHWLGDFSEKEPQLIKAGALGVARRLDLPVSYVETYLRIVRRCLTADDLRGQALFLEELDRCTKAQAYPWS